MEGFVHILRKNTSSPQKSKESIINIINHFKNTNHSFKIIQNEQVTGVYFTNEHGSFPYEHSETDLFCPVGQFTIKKKELQQQLKSSSYKHKKEIISQLSGAFSISLVNLLQNSIDIFTHVVRAESVYIYEDSNITVVGSDPLIVSVFSNNDLKPQFDSSNFISYFEQGYFADENTPYYNVTCLPPNSHININANSININDIDNTFRNPFSEEASDQLFNEITNNFIKSFNIVHNKSKPIKADLTGGKDSRVVLLALLENNFNVSTRTTGFSDHPDVIIAKRLAEELGVAHNVNQRKVKSSNQLSINLENRIHTIMNASSGMLSAYDSVTTKMDFNDNIIFNGVAASVITGGFNKMGNGSKYSPQEAFKRTVYKFNDFYLDQDNKYSKHLNHFAKQSNNTSELLHLFFLLYRTGRWTSDSRIPKSYATNSYSIFLDNQLTKSTMKLNLESLREEIIHYKLIEKLRPEILNIPFFKYRYAFEKNGPVSINDYDNWLQREPIYANSEIGKYNWRSLGNNDEQLVNSFKDLILSYKNHSVFDVVDYNKVDSLLNAKLTSRTNKFIWSIASMIHFTNYIHKQSRPESIHLNLNIPSDKLIEKNRPSKVVDLTPYYNSLNASVNYNNQEFTVTKSIGNPYIITFKGNLNVVPDSTNIEYYKTLYLNTNLTIYEYHSEIKMVFIFYNNKKRFKSIIIYPNDYVNNTVSFRKDIDIPKHAKYFRVAIHLKDISTSSTNKLNYSYIELKPS